MTDTPAVNEEPKVAIVTVAAETPTATGVEVSSPAVSTSSPSGDDEKKDDIASSVVRPYVPPTPSIFAVSSPSEAKLLLSTSITQYPAAPTYTHPPLRNAELSDLVDGNTIYVRGRRAIIRRLDFPLIFWSSEGEDVEKHRSYHADPTMFKVEAIGGIADEKTATSVGATDEKDVSKEGAAKALSATIVGGHKVVEYKSIKKREVIHCDAKYPSSVYVEECEDCSIFVPDKVSQITLVNCRNVTVRFITVIAKVEVIRSTSCIIICGSICATYTCDGSTDTRFIFAAKDVVSAITWISASSSGTRLIGRIVDAAAPSSDEKEIKDELAAHDGDINHDIVTPAAPTPPTDDASPAVVPQYTTSFIAGAYSATTLLVREGSIGYIAPTAATPSA